MQKTKIEWAEFVSNPVRGKCGHFGTPICGTYCYADAMRARFHQPGMMSWHPEELAAIERRKKPATIFMGSAYDIFGEWVPSEWICKIIGITVTSPQHTYLFLTKNPKRYEGPWTFPKNCWLGYTDDGTVYKNHNGNKALRLGNWFISYEPLIGDKSWFCWHAKAYIIGAMSGPLARNYPTKREWVDELINHAQVRNIPVFLKDNLLEKFPDLPRLKQLPWQILGQHEIHL